MIFSLAQDFHDAVAAMPREHPKHRMLELLEEAIRRDIHFIARHPTTLFQCMWNTCWWYDSSEAAKHYQIDSATASGIHPWTTSELKLSSLLESWQASEPKRRGNAVWLKCLRPRPFHLDDPLRSVLAGLGSCVGVAWLPKGYRLVSISTDSTIRVWDALSQCEIAACACREQPTCVSVSTDGSRIAVGTQGGAIMLFDSAALSPLGQWTLHGEGVTCLSFFHHSKRVVSVGDDGCLRVSDTETMREISWGQTEEKHITAVTLSSDDEIIISGGHDKVIRTWRSESLKPVAVLPLAAPDLGGSLPVSPRARAHVLFMSQAGLTNVSSLACCTHGESFVSGAYDGAVRVWNVQNGIQTACLLGHEEKIRSVDISSDGGLVASGGGEDNTLRLWDMSRQIAIQCFPHPTPVNQVALSPDGRYVSSVSEDGIVRIWSTEGSHPSYRLADHSDAINSLAVTSTHQEIISVSDDKSLRIWSAENGSLCSVFYDPDVFVSSMVVAPSHNWLAFAVGGLRPVGVGVIDLTRRVFIAQFAGHCYGVTNLVFSADGMLLASVSSDLIAIWDLSQSTERCRLHGPVDDVQCVAFSPDGSWLISGHSDGTAQVWDGFNGQPLKRLEGHQKAIRSLGFAPDGQRIAAGSEDGVLIIWSREGAQTGRLDLRGGPITRTVWNDDTTLIADIIGARSHIVDAHEWKLRQTVCGAGDPLAVATERLPWLVVSNGEETTVLQLPHYEPAAWFPGSLSHLTHVPGTNRWAGAQGSHLEFLSVVGGAGETRPPSPGSALA